MAKVIKNIFCKKVSKSFNYVYYLDILLGESTYFALTKQIAVSFLTIGGVFLFVFVYVFAFSFLNNSQIHIGQKF